MTNLRSFVTPSGLRLAHSYLSAFIAPTIVFFAISGSLQIFDLHQAHGQYEPSSLVSAMAGLHKDQVFAPEPQRGATRPQGRAASPRGPQSGGRETPTSSPATKLLKFLFAFDALALVTTTFLGLWIGVTHPKRARTFWALLAAGILLPMSVIVVSTIKT